MARIPNVSSLAFSESSRMKNYMQGVHSYYLLKVIHTERFSSVASMTALAYDFLLTFKDEVLVFPLYCAISQNCCQISYFWVYTLFLGFDGGNLNLAPDRYTKNGG